MGNKHKHADMICAKSNNMNLIAFFKNNTGEWLKKAPQSNAHFNADYEYFLCLPKHEEACLHWLNGGDIQCESVGNHSWCNIEDDDYTWSELTVFMSDGHNTRIKPKKVKRWMYADDQGNTSLHFESKEVLVEAFRYTSLISGQKIVSFEIELDDD